MSLLLVLLGVALVGLLVWLWFRHRYIESLRAKGWQFIDSPPISIVFGLNVAPFGMGFNRRVNDQIVGAAKDGTPFSAFKYSSTEWRTSGYVLTMPLPRSLPPGAVWRGQWRLPDLGPSVAQEDLTASGHVSPYAQFLLDAIGPHLSGGYRITVDHNQLVLFDAPTDADPLEQSVELLATLRSLVLDTAPAALRWKDPPRQLSFHRHNDWVYLPRDDSYLGAVGHSRGGFDHEAHDVIYSDNSGIPFVRLRHTWKTRHTRTDSEGRTHTEIRNHEEFLCEFRTSFPFPDFSVNWGIFGRAQKFEWEEFNRRFDVRTTDARFGSDVMHQRQMEFFMQSSAPKFRVERGVIEVAGGRKWLPENIEAASSFLHGFFGRVPNFVWQQLGASPRPIAEITSSGP